MKSHGVFAYFAILLFQFFLTRTFKKMENEKHSMTPKQIKVFCKNVFIKVTNKFHLLGWRLEQLLMKLCLQVQNHWFDLTQN